MLALCAKIDVEFRPFNSRDRFSYSQVLKVSRLGEGETIGKNTLLSLRFSRHSFRRIERHE